MKWKDALPLELASNTKGKDKKQNKANRSGQKLNEGDFEKMTICSRTQVMISAWVNSQNFPENTAKKI